MNSRAFATSLIGSALIFAASASQAGTIEKIGPADFGTAFAGAQTYTFAPINTAGTVTSGPGATSVDIAPGITWLGEDGTIYGKTGAFGFDTNGTWDLDKTPALGTAPPIAGDPDLAPVTAYIGYDGENAYEAGFVIRFDAPVKGVGAYLNFRYPPGNDYGRPILSVWDANPTPGQLGGPNGNFDVSTSPEYLDFLDIEPPPFDINGGFYFGFTSDEADIAEIRFSGSFLSIARLYVNTVPEPQGLALMLTALGILGATLRRRGSRV